eukprot:TRINITY_DN10603_c0_g1_i1.p1 TRINITY_DN10603_c0_g1~~TRINITY_DN10603_c0_g1_i1.p1  ORF type:complete len:683 (+),score=146.01 TRINITY_DN10603_c0_g1_i1:89-2050(+)
MYGQVTSWPCALAGASTWDTDLVQQWATAMGKEHRAKGSNVLLGPGVNFNRVALCGRTAEYLTGEDPHFGAEMATAFVVGVQSQKVMATVKHFALNNQENIRNDVNALVDERTLREIYLPAFEAAVEAGVASVMCSYNLVNGTHACGHEGLLNGILRDDWGFEGWVMSDWAATHGLWCDKGLDQDMPGSLVDDDHFDYYNASNLATVDKAIINKMVYRILLQFIKVGAFDSPVCETGGGCDTQMYAINATNDEHRTLARTLVANGIQLLANDGVLPLDTLPDNSTIAVIGSACNPEYLLDNMTATWNLGNYYLVGGSGRVINHVETVSLLTGVTRRAQRTTYTVVYDTSDNVSSSLKLMQSATVAIVCGATGAAESKDRSNLLLDQDTFISELLSQKPTNVLVVVALQTPGPVLTNWRNSANAILNMFLSGEATGSAWADVLFGDVNPSGRLPITFPASVADTISPCSNVNCPYTEGLFVGYRGLLDKPVAYPFGHGLSYTNFTYTWSTQPATTGCGSDVLVCMDVKITNSGQRDGADILQLYVKYPDSANEPPRQLKAFKKVFLSVGESKTVKFELNMKSLSVWNVVTHAWKLVKGKWTVFVGASSRDVRLTGTFSVPETTPTTPPSSTSTLCNCMNVMCLLVLLNWLVSLF